MTLIVTKNPYSMKNIIRISAIFVFAIFLACQIIAQQVVPVAGDYFETETFSLSFSIGEPITETLSTEESNLTQGFQQPWIFIYTQSLTIPSGWSGISGFVDPFNKNIEDIFMDEINHLLFLSNLSGFYFPSQNINTLNEWDFSSGYKAKATQSFTINLKGTKHKNYPLDLEAGWSIIPVLSGCNIPVTDIFDEYSEVLIVKDIGNTGIYWPEFNINTLLFLQPGKAYFAMLDEASTIIYPGCTKSGSFTRPIPVLSNITSWNNPVKTAQSHLVLIPKEFIVEAEWQPGNIIGGFTPEGQCAGMVVIEDSNENVALTLFGDDPLTETKDGFSEGGSIKIRKFSVQKGIDDDLEIQFDPAFPNQGYFTADGVSALKTAAIAVGELGGSSKLDFAIYPNPARENVTILWNQAGGEKGVIELFNTFGQRVETLFLSSKEDGLQQYELDISGFEKGTWLIRLSTGSRVGIKKLVIIK